MKNTLPFVLIMMTIEITNLNAQVRIGGLTEPNKAAVLDLNASDATNDGSRGLALPRVSLADTLALLNGTVPSDGVMVYNTNTVLGEGIYVWGSDKWSQVVMPLRADSGQYMQYNGTSWNPATVGVVTRSYWYGEAGAPLVNFSADSTGFGTTKVFIPDCPCLLDMLPVHGQFGYSIPGNTWDLWSVYFENHQDSIYQFPSYPPGTYVEKHYDVYTMGFMLRQTDQYTGKPFWGGSAIPNSHGLTQIIFRCLKF